MNKRTVATGLLSLGMLSGCTVSSQDMNSLSGAPSFISLEEMTNYESRQELALKESTQRYANLDQKLRTYTPPLNIPYNASLMTDPLSSDISALTIDDIWAARAFGENVELCVEMSGQGKQYMMFSNREFADSKHFTSTMINLLRQVDSSKELPQYTSLKNKDMFGDYSFFTITPSSLGSPNISFNSLEYYGWKGGIPTERNSRHVTIEYKEGIRASQTGLSFSEGIQRGLRFATGAIATELLNLGDVLSRKVLNRTRNPVSSFKTSPPLGARGDAAVALWHQFASAQKGQPEKIIMYLDEVENEPRLVIATGPKDSGAFYFEPRSISNSTLVLRDKKHTEAIEWPFLGKLEETGKNLKRSP